MLVSFLLLNAWQSANCYASLGVETEVDSNTLLKKLLETSKPPPTDSDPTASDRGNLLAHLTPKQQRQRADNIAAAVPPFSASSASSYGAMSITQRGMESSFTHTSGSDLNRPISDWNNLSIREKQHLHGVASKSLYAFSLLCLNRLW